MKFIAEEVCHQLKIYTHQDARIHFGEGDRGWRGDVPYTHLEGSKLNQLGWAAKLDSDGAIRRAIVEIVADIMGEAYPV